METKIRSLGLGVLLAGAISILCLQCGLRYVGGREGIPDDASGGAAFPDSDSGAKSKKPRICVICKDATYLTSLRCDMERCKEHGGVDYCYDVRTMTTETTHHGFTCR